MEDIPVSLKKEICDCYSDPDRCCEKLSVCLLSFETTRRCNLKCIHCMKGDAQAVDIKPEVFDQVFENFGIVDRIGFAGGEIMLNLGALRYALESLKRHHVQVNSALFTTNGIILDPEFLKIYDEYIAFVKKPEKCEILISNDMFHLHASGKSQKDMEKIKEFFRNGDRENNVSFQDVVEDATVYRIGRASKGYDLRCDYRGCKSSADVWSRYHDYAERYSSEEETELRKLYAKLRYFSEDRPLFKSPITHFDNHVCTLEVSATGYYLNCDIITYEDEDKPEFYIDQVSTPVKEIIAREDSDPVYRSLGYFLKVISEIDVVGRSIMGLIRGPMGLPVFFPDIEKIKSKLQYVYNMAKLMDSFCDTSIDYLRKVPGAEKKIQEIEKSYATIRERGYLKQLAEELEKL